MSRHGQRAAIALALVAVLAAPAWADSTWTTVGMEQTSSWQAPSGAPTYIEWTLDGSHLLVLGTGGPRTIQVLDRDLSPVATVESPFEVAGASWSMTGQTLMAWGPGAARDELGFWDVPSFAPNASVVPRELLSLVNITAARFFSGDAILVLAGRGLDGTSRLNVVEVLSSALHQDIAHPDNRTVLSLHNDGRMVVCIEEGGYVHGFSGQNWDGWTFLCPLTGEVTAHSIEWMGEWLAGDANGVVRGWSAFDYSQKYSTQLDRGPVQAIAWMLVLMVHNFVAIPAQGGGSQLQVWRECPLVNETGPFPILVSEYNFSSPITVMAPIPGVGGNLTIGHADGSLAILRVNATIVHWPADDEPLPPDGGDGNGTGDGDGDGRSEWWGTYGSITAIVVLAAAIAGAYVWLRRREG